MGMTLRDVYIISGQLYKEAYDYAKSSRAYTSNRHDFHAGGLNNKQRKMFEGKLGEKALKMFFIDNCIPFKEDTTPYWQRDKYDFLITDPKGKYKSLKIDVKTRTESFHIRTLEMVEQAKSHPKDIYISARLYREKNAVKLLGWFSYEDMITKNDIENLGYLDNYVMYDKDLRPMSEFYDYLLSFYFFF